MILLEEIIERNIDKLFLGYDVVCAHPYRIMRNADLSIDEDGAEDLLVEIQKQGCGKPNRIYPKSYEAVPNTDFKKSSYGTPEG